VRSAHALGAETYTPAQLEAWTSRINPTRLEARLLSTVSFAAEEDGRLIGFASLDPEQAELDFLYVHPHYARRGIGRVLTEEVEREAESERVGRRGRRRGDARD
jgi:putative acetyltransferase